MLLSDKIAITPFVKIIPLFAMGILAFGYVTAPDWMVLLVTLLAYAMAWWQRDNRYGGWYIGVTLFCSGMLVASMVATRELMPRGERLTMVAEVNQTPVIRGRWQRTTARVGLFRPASKGPAGTWQETDERVELYVDTACRIVPGEQLSVTGYLHPMDTTGSRYEALMRSRGLSARIYISGDHLVRLSGDGRRATRFAATLQGWAVERIGRLKISENDRNMLSALIAGEKRSVDRNLKADYAKTGMAHILAVSGLHMGFVLILIHFLFGWTVLFRQGHRIKNVLVILALWGYAVMAGLSPSVVRAALMLSAAQIALASSVPGNGYNVVLGTATLMLAVNPFYLYDISFQLSFCAVLSILFFYPRLYRKRLSMNRFLDTVYSSVLLGVAAQIGTIPLVVYNFGNIPVIAVLINPLVIFMAFLTIFVGLIWVLCAFSWLNGMFSMLLEGFLWVQNGVVSWAASTPVASFSGIRFDGYALLCSYLLLILMAVAVKLYEEGGRNRSNYNV